MWKQLPEFLLARHSTSQWLTSSARESLMSTELFFVQFGDYLMGWTAPMATLGVSTGTGLCVSGLWSAPSQPDPPEMLQPFSKSTAPSAALNSQHPPLPPSLGLLPLISVGQLRIAVFMALEFINDAQRETIVLWLRQICSLFSFVGTPFPGLQVFPSSTLSFPCGVISDADVHAKEES